MRDSFGGQSANPEFHIERLGQPLAALVYGVAVFTIVITHRRGPALMGDLLHARREIRRAAVDHARFCSSHAEPESDQG